MAGLVLALAGVAGGVTAVLAVLTGLRCGALAAVLRGALAGVLADVVEAGAALVAGLAAALPEDAVLPVLAAFALGAEEMVVSFMVYRLSKK